LLSNSKHEKKESDSAKSDLVKMDLIYSEDTQFKYWTSRLFNEVYLRKDLPVVYSKSWENDDSKEFQYFMGRLRDLAFEYGKNEKELRDWSETETINNWVKPILDALGWSDKCTKMQTPFLEETSFTYANKVYRTDILIVDIPKEAKYIREAEGDEKIREARNSILIPVEAKYWKRLEQYRLEINEDQKRRDQKDDDISRITTPNEQILRYMDVFRKDWGMLTDGATWRLFNREISSDDPERCFDFNLYSLIESILTEKNEHDRKEVTESAKYFYFFFSKNSHFPKNSGEEAFVNEILRYSKRYVSKIEEDLKERFISAMNHACNGLYRAVSKQKKEVDLSTIRSVSESALFNILFIKSIESRNILPMNNPNYRKLSISNIIDKIEDFDPEKDIEINIRNLNRVFKQGNGNSFSYENLGIEIHDRIIRLTKIIHDGKSPKDDFGFEIAGFKQSIFSNLEWKIFQECKLENSSWTQILFELAYAESDIKSRKYQQIPYSYFTPRQLGSIYESFLEFKLDVAEVDLIFEKKQWKPADLKSKKYRESKLPTVRKGELYFTPDNSERKATGSYYTPDYIVQFIVNETLDFKKYKSSKEILNLKICDPAMGSGHFLVNSLKWLTSKYIELMASESEGDLKISQQEAKRRVLDSCIFGVDINPRAVKLSKMSLWLESAHINYKLERLDDHLLHGDSLIENASNYSLSFQWKNKFPRIFSEGGFDAVVGNPPYIFARNNRFSDEQKSYFTKNYNWSSFQSNSYCLFVELAYKILKTEGRLGFVIPNNWMTLSSCLKFREEFLVSFEETQIVNCYDKIFKEASVDCSLIIATKNSNKNKLCELLTLKDGKFETVYTGKIKGTTINFSSSEIDEDLFESLERAQTLGELYVVKSGLVAYEVGKGLPSQTKEMKNTRVYHSKMKLDSSYLPYLHGKDVCRYELKDVREYIKYGPNLAAPRKVEIFKSPRVLVRQIPSKLPYCIEAVATDSFLINDRNSNNVICDNFEEALFVMAVLNSKTVSEWFVKKFDKFQRKTFPQFKVNELELFPIPSASIAEKNRISEYAQKLMSAIRLNNKEKIKSLDEKIEKIVTQLFLSRKLEIKKVS